MIKEVSLKNFKCFESLTTVEMSRFTILYGKNGRGKSSVIQSLLLLSQSLRENGVNLNTLIINGPMSSLGSYEDIRNCYSNENAPIEINIKNELDQILSLKYKRTPNKPTIALLDDIWFGGVHYVSDVANEQSYLSESTNDGVEDDNIKENIILTQSDINLYSELKSLLFVAADRRGPANFESRRDNINSNEVDVRGNFIINSLATKSPEFMERFSQELSLILSGATVRVYENPDTPDRLELFLDSVNGAGAGFRPSNVGYGYSYILPIIYQTLTAPKGGIVVVENPEAHLYPAAQSRLVNFLVKYSNKNQLQIILETHSDHIINGLRIAVKDKDITPSETSILFLDRKDDDRSNPVVETIKIDQRGALSKQPKDFMDEWTRQMIELM